MRRQRPHIGVLVWRNRANMVSGWLIGYGLFLFVSYLDPLGLFTSPGQADTRLDTELVLIHLFFLVLSVVGFALWAVPLVQTAPGVVTIVNPLTTWTLPSESLGTLREGSMFPLLTSDGRTIRLWGLERSVLDTMRGHIVVPTAEPTSPSAGGVVPRVKRSLDPALVLLVALWLAVSIAGVVSAAM